MYIQLNPNEKPVAWLDSKPDKTAFKNGQLSFNDEVNPYKPKTGKWFSWNAGRRDPDEIYENYCRLRNQQIKQIKNTLNKSKMGEPAKKPAKKRTVTAKKLCRGVIKVPGINSRTGQPLKGWHYVGGKLVKATTKKPAKRKVAKKTTAKKAPTKKATTKKATTKKTIKKHPAINQTTGRLKKGWRHDGKGGYIQSKKK